MLAKVGAEDSSILAITRARASLDGVWSPINHTFHPPADAIPVLWLAAACIQQHEPGANRCVLTWPTCDLDPPACSRAAVFGKVVGYTIAYRLI